MSNCLTGMNSPTSSGCFQKAHSSRDPFIPILITLASSKTSIRHHSLRGIAAPWENIIKKILSSPILLTPRCKIFCFCLYSIIKSQRQQQCHLLSHFLQKNEQRVAFLGKVSKDLFKCSMICPEKDMAANRAP